MRLVSVVEDNPGVVVLAGFGAFAHLEPANAAGQHQHGLQRTGRDQLRSPPAGNPLEADEQGELAPACFASVSP